MTIHAGEQLWLLVDLWVDDILRHFLFRGRGDNPVQFVAGPPDGTSMCVWELEIVKHERDAWVEHVLTKPAKPSFPAYLAAACSRENEQF